MRRLFLAMVLGMLFLSSVCAEAEDPSLLWPLDVERRLGRMEQEVKAASALASDNRVLLRDGTAVRASVLQRLVQLEDQQRKTELWQAETKSSADQARALLWALVVALVGHCLTGAWAVAGWWARRNRERNRDRNRDQFLKPNEEPGKD